MEVRSEAKRLDSTSGYSLNEAIQYAVALDELDWVGSLFCGILFVRGEKMDADKAGRIATHLALQLVLPV